MPYAPRFVSRADYDAAMPVALAVLDDFQAIRKAWGVGGVTFYPADDFEADTLGAIFTVDDAGPTWFDGVTVGEAVERSGCPS